METPPSREDVNRRLAEIQEELWAPDENDFKARYELQRERDEPRDRVRTSVDQDDVRSTDDLLEELRARRNALAQIQESMVNSAVMSGGDGAGSHEDGVKLNSEILAVPGRNIWRRGSRDWKRFSRSERPSADTELAH